MYLEQLAIYLTWPAFIFVSWLIIRSALVLYEKKYTPDGEDEILSGRGEEK